MCHVLCLCTAPPSDSTTLLRNPNDSTKTAETALHVVQIVLLCIFLAEVSNHGYMRHSAIIILLCIFLVEVSNHGSMRQFVIIIPLCIFLAEVSISIMRHSGIIILLCLFKAKVSYQVIKNLLMPVEYPVNIYFIQTNQYLHNGVEQ